VLIDGEERVRKLMHAHDLVQLIFDQVNVDMQNMMMENGHGSILSSAGALSGMAGDFLYIHIGSARGMPSRLTCASAEVMLWGRILL
jgi:hypothetical protein